MSLFAKELCGEARQESLDYLKEFKYRALPFVLEAPENCLPARFLPACLPAKRATASSAEDRKGSLVSAGNLKTNHTNVYTQQQEETGT